MDAGFKSAPYPGHTLMELQGFVAAGRGNDAMVAEIARRGKVRAGDRSVMTAGERLRWAKVNAA